MTRPTPPTGTPLRWALLGASWIAETRVAPALIRSGQRVVSVFSRNTERAARFADQFGASTATTVLAESIDPDIVDAVYISSTNDQHRAQAEAAAMRGLHVLCEKPLADDMADARSVVKACKSAGVVLGVNHHLVAAGTHARIREIATQGAIGEIRAVRVQHSRLLPEELRRWRLGASTGAGVVLDVMSHDASLMNALLSPRLPRDVVATGVRQGPWNSGSEDAAMTVVRYDDVLAQTHDGFTTPYAPTRFEVLGSAGAVVGVDVLSQDPVGTVVLHNAGGTTEVDVPDREDLYQKVVAAFVAATRGDGRPTVDGEGALLASSVAAAAVTAAGTGQRTAVERGRHA